MERGKRRNNDNKNTYYKFAFTFILTMPASFVCLSGNNRAKVMKCICKAMTNAILEIFEKPHKKIKMKESSMKGYELLKFWPLV